MKILLIYILLKIFYKLKIFSLFLLKSIIKSKFYYCFFYFDYLYIYIFFLNKEIQ
jgi:hypothetical protein